MTLYKWFFRSCLFCVLFLFECKSLVVCFVVGDSLVMDDVCGAVVDQADQVVDIQESLQRVTSQPSCYGYFVTDLESPKESIQQSGLVSHGFTEDIAEPISTLNVIKWRNNLKNLWFLCSLKRRSCSKRGHSLNQQQSCLRSSLRGFWDLHKMPEKAAQNP